MIPIEELKERARTGPYVLEHYPKVALRRSGSVHQTCCPFHEDKSPSFTIFENGSWKCFGCGEHGDVIDFVMKMEHVSFKEACKMIGENVGVEVVLTPPNTHHEAHKDAMDEHTRRYWRNLQTNTDVMNYLKVERGLTEATINQFRLGLVPGDEYRVRNDIGGISDRLAFPILEHKDEKLAKCVGMGYRTMKDEKPKYINDVNQDGRPAQNNRPAQNANVAGVFIKGNLLYGYPWAHREIRKSNYAVITEGYFDVISLHQAGIKNAVACMGTSLTEVQADTLRSLTGNLILFMDGDSAGISNMVKVLPMLFEKGFNVMMLVAEGNMDAADICKKMNFDTAKMQTYLSQQAKPALSVVIDRTVESYEQIVVRERLKAMGAIAPLLEKVQNPYERDVYKSKVYKRLDMEM